MSFEYQSALLGYFAQQSVAHGAMLFSAVIATFYFFRLLKEKEIGKSRAGPIRTLSILLLGGLLVGACVYVLGRIVLYGALSYSTIRTTPTCANLSQYYDQVMFTTSYRGDWFWQLYLLFGNSPPAGTYFAWHISSIAIGCMAATWLLWTLDVTDLDADAKHCVLIVALGALSIEALLTLRTPLLVIAAVFALLLLGAKKAALRQAIRLWLKQP